MTFEEYKQAFMRFIDAYPPHMKTSVVMPKDKHILGAMDNGIIPEQYADFTINYYNRKLSVLR